MNTPRHTSLPLILLTLLVGAALGWALRDLLFRPAGQAQIPPSASPAATLAAADQPTPIPAATSTPWPSVTPQPPAPSATAAPSPSAIPTMPPTATVAPSATPEPPTPAAQAEIVAYSTYRVSEGDTLEQIAGLGGSDPDLIASYNLLSGPPRAGQALIVPQLAGRSSQLTNEPELIERGAASRPWVALTLDAGADAAPTGGMLDTLRDRGVQITFFLTGKWIRENPELARRIVAEGHEIANHTFHHPDLRTLDEAAIQSELEDTDRAMREVAGVGTRPFFRPPFGAYDKRVLQTIQSLGYLPIYWTLDSLDSVGEPKTPEFLLERVTARLPPDQLRGAIILAHCGSPATAEALPAILDRFAEMGFEVRKLSDVLNS